MVYEEVKSEFVNLEVDEVIEGTLTAIEKGQYGDVYRMTRSGGEVVLLGSKSALGNRIDAGMIGKRLRITRLVDEASKNVKGRTFQNFKVEVDR